MRECVDDLSNGQAALDKCTSDGTTLNPTDSLSLRQLITPATAGQLGSGTCRLTTGLGLMFTPSHCNNITISVVNSPSRPSETFGQTDYHILNFEKD